MEPTDKQPKTKNPSAKCCEKNNPSFELCAPYLPLSMLKLISMFLHFQAL